MKNQDKQKDNNKQVLIIVALLGLFILMVKFWYITLGLLAILLALYFTNEFFRAAINNSIKNRMRNLYDRIKRIIYPPRSR